jgi:hypothetical protein
MEVCGQLHSPAILPPKLEPTHSHIQWVSWAYHLGVKWPGREADYLPPSSERAKTVYALDRSATVTGLHTLHILHACMHTYIHTYILIQGTHDQLVRTHVRRRHKHGRSKRKIMRNGERDFVFSNKHILV